MSTREHSEEAKRWFRNYNGSIDATALLLAYDAGQRQALVDAGHDFLRAAQADVEPVLNETAGKLLMTRAEKIGVLRYTAPIDSPAPAALVQGMVADGLVRMAAVGSQTEEL